MNKIKYWSKKIETWWFNQQIRRCEDDIDREIRRHQERLAQFERVRRDYIAKLCVRLSHDSVYRRPVDTTTDPF